MNFTCFFFNVAIRKILNYTCGLHYISIGQCCDLMYFKQKKGKLNNGGMNNQHKYSI